MTFTTCRGVWPQGCGTQKGRWRKLWRKRNVMHCQSAGATGNRNQWRGCKSPAPVLSQQIQTATLTCIPQSPRLTTRALPLSKFLFQKWIPKTWGRRERREACRPLLNNFHVNRALLSNFMFLDPSHRNEIVSISGHRGAKGKISSGTEQNSMCPSVSWKDPMQS